MSQYFKRNSPNYNTKIKALLRSAFCKIKNGLNDLSDEIYSK